MQKTFSQLYGILPFGVLVLDKNYTHTVYCNPAYASVLAMQYDKILSSEHHNSLVEGFRKNRNKEFGTLRIVPDDGEILFIDAFASELKVFSEEYVVISLVPLKNRESMHKTRARESYIFDDLRVSIPNQLVKVRGTVVNFSETEFKLFVFLCKNEDRLFSKDDLLKHVWGLSARNTRTVDMYVSRIKKRLRLAGCKKDYIKTMHGRGYMFQIIG